ncbi:hypothetical protein QMG83_05130 [Salinibacterium sp. G-O1]|uniref:hypothetical protein n=1 Tax=Salinibacterium sp. G-O1 TaxID=3046208 RepID=UPI0024BAF9F4|nr:hypothetical protein [Salinibacterium sp. G-O1]MDJ0334600.1 hypothetical protein [Salinibacterium sp. G-O1]
MSDQPAGDHDNDEPVLGVPPSLPDGVWERLMQATLDAAPDASAAELLPDDSAGVEDDGFGDHPLGELDHQNDGAHPSIFEDGGLDPLGYEPDPHHDPGLDAGHDDSP